MNIQRICMDERQLWQVPVSALTYEHTGYHCIIDGKETYFLSVADQEEAQGDYGLDVDDGEVLLTTGGGHAAFGLDDMLTIVVGYRGIIPPNATPKRDD